MQFEIVIFTSSKIQYKCNFNEIPFENTIQKFGKNLHYFLLKWLKCITEVTFYGRGGAHLVLSGDVMPVLLFYILGLQLCLPIRQAEPVKEIPVSGLRKEYISSMYIHVHLRKTLFWSIMKALLWYLCISAKTIVPFLPLASPQAIQKICLKLNKKLMTLCLSIWFTICQFDLIWFFY